jgi:pilus assembly protein CpaF
MEDERVALQPLFIFRQTGIDPEGQVKGYFTATGTVPHCMEQLVESGEELPISIFQPATPAS